MSRARAAALAGILLSAGCAKPIKMETVPAVPECRATVPPPAAVRWIGPDDEDDRRRLLQWCTPVGPAVLHLASPAPPARRPLVVVSWNMAVGEGKLQDLVTSVREMFGKEGESDLVLLVQEAYRGGPDLPNGCPEGSRVARRLGSPRPAGSLDIIGVATGLGLHAAYVPSMRNGQNCDEEPREDRGNAILSTLPIGDVTAIELPFAQQRRVAVAATVTYDGHPLTVVSTHFDTTRGHKRHAQALVLASRQLGWPARVVIGGDLNSHLFSHAGPRELNKAFPELDCPGPTHASGQRLDHLFARGFTPQPQCTRLANRFDSDHHALVTTLSP